MARKKTVAGPKYIGLDKYGVPIYAGQTVRCVTTRTDGNYGYLRGHIGTVLEQENGFISIAYCSWNDFHAGHSCDGLLDDNSGWNFLPKELEVIDQSEQDPVAPPDLTEVFWL